MRIYRGQTISVLHVCIVVICIYYNLSVVLLLFLFFWFTATPHRLIVQYRRRRVKTQTRLTNTITTNENLTHEKNVYTTFKRERRKIKKKISLITICILTCTVRDGRFICIYFSVYVVTVE